MVRPKVLVSGHIAWAHAELQDILGPYGDIVYLDSPSRGHFKNTFLPANPNIVAIYRHNSSADKIGVYDKELVDLLPDTVKYIAHNGAGYDQIDVFACKARGSSLCRIGVDQVESNTRYYLQGFKLPTRPVLSTLEQRPPRFISSFLP